VKISLQASFDEAIHSGTVVNERQRTRPCPSYSFKRGPTGAEVPLYDSITGNFMIYQDRHETKSL